MSDRSSQDFAWAAGAPWSGVPGRDVLDILASAGRARPGEPAILFEDGLVLSCGELLDRAEHLAGYLQASLRAGDPVAVMLENRAEFFVSWLAIAANRAVTVSVNPAAGTSDCEHLLRDSGSVLAIVSGACREVVESVRGACPALRDVLYLDEPASRTAPSRPRPSSSIALSGWPVTRSRGTSGSGTRISLARRRCG